MNPGGAFERCPEPLYQAAPDDIRWSFGAGPATDWLAVPVAGFGVARRESAPFTPSPRCSVKPRAFTGDEVSVCG